MVQLSTPSGSDTIHFRYQFGRVAISHFGLFFSFSTESILSVGLQNTKEVNPLA